MMTSKTFAEEARSPDRPYRDVIVCLWVSLLACQFLKSKFSFWLIFSVQDIKSRAYFKTLSLYEGTAGTACFLADVLNPEDAEFPFFDIFA